MGYSSLKKNIIRTYTDPTQPASFTSSSKIQKQKFHHTPLKKIKSALENIDAYTKHKSYTRKFPRLKTVTGGIDKQWQLDLIDMQAFSKANKGYKHILVGIDVFSRFGFAEPIKSKKGEDIVEAFKKMTQKRQPKYVQTDKGKEFLNSLFQKYLKYKKIHFFTSENEDIKCSLAERFNGTLQGKMWKFFTHTNTFKYIDVLQDLVKSYNDTKHATLNIAPSEVNEHNSESLFYKLYEKPQSKPHKGRSLKVGDKVRILEKKKTFNRGYEPNWTEEMFTVYKVNQNTYSLKDLMGEEIKGRFYPQEVQKVFVSPQKKFYVEKILKSRGKGKKKEVLVKWKGYSDKFNTWEPHSEITKT